MLKSANKFAHLLNSAKPTLEEGVPLTNVTFFLGAGFSKSWDEAFPVGNDLFPSPTTSGWNMTGRWKSSWL